MRRAWRWWMSLLSRRERGTGLAAFRIAVGLVMLGSILSVVLAGLVGVVWVDAAHGGVREVSGGFWPLVLAGGARPSVVWTLVSLSLGASTLMVIGLGGRWMVLLAALTYRAVSTSGGSGGYDSMIGNAAWLLVLADSTRTLSLDCRRRTGRWTCEDAVAAWPRYVAIFQLVVIYLATGLQKTSASWTFADGYSALYWFLQDPAWTRWDMRSLAHGFPLTQVATFVVWHFEVASPLLLLAYWYRDTPERAGRFRALFCRYDYRRGFAAVGLGMHVGILLLLNMGPFSWVSFAFYLCLWTPDEIEAAYAWLSRRRGRRRTTPALPGTLARILYALSWTS